MATRSRQSDKSAIEAAIAALKTALEGEDVEAIKARTNDLMQAQMKLGEAMYKAQQAAGAGRRRRGGGASAEGRRHRRGIPGSRRRQEEVRLTWRMTPAADRGRPSTSGDAAMARRRLG